MTFMEKTEKYSGIITTFYSFKGGVGRSMALSNLACLMAKEVREPILLIDWDLEAPGLHRFFYPGHSRFAVDLRPIWVARLSGVGRQSIHYVGLFQPAAPF